MAKIKGPLLYDTRQINLKLGDQLRITAGRRTVFVFVNRRGLNFRKGGYAPAPKQS